VFLQQKAQGIILAGSGSEDDEVDVGREVGTRSDDDFISDQEELSDTEDHVETIENLSSKLCGVIYPYFLPCMRSQMVYYNRDYSIA
jgi:hypothetical protein